MRDVPVVSLNVNPDHVFDREQVGIHAGSEEALSEAVRGFVMDSPRRAELGARARVYARKHHSVRNAELLAQLIDTGTGCRAILAPSEQESRSAIATLSNGLRDGDASRYQQLLLLSRRRRNRVSRAQPYVREPELASYPLRDAAPKKPLLALVPPFRRGDRASGSTTRCAASLRAPRKSSTPSKLGTSLGGCSIRCVRMSATHTTSTTISRHPSSAFSTIAAFRRL